MAPLVQWAIQFLLGSTRTKDLVSGIETRPQMTYQAFNKPATPQEGGSVGVSAVSWGPNRIDVYVGPFEDGRIGHKYWNGFG